MGQETVRDKLVKMLEDVSGKHMDSGELSTYADMISDLLYTEPGDIVVEKHILEDCLEAIKKLKDTFEKVKPQYTEDVILVNDLKTLEYRIQEKLFNNK